MIDIKNYREDNFEYNAVILENNFPKELLELIEEFYKTMNEFLFALVDKIGYEIHSYGLYLESNKKDIYNITIDGQNISFYSKFPTSKGFIDDCPWEHIKD